MKYKRSLIHYVDIPKISDDCFLYFVQSPDHIPFAIKRVYYILKSRPNLPRGSHAHYKTQQIIFCIQGSIRMILDDGSKREEVILNQPETGILLDRMIWHEMHNFQKDTILLVLASRKYEDKDYIRDHEQFLAIANGNNKKTSKI